MNLQELTGYESGVVVFKESNKGIAINWSSIEGIPRIFVTGVIGLGDGDDLQTVEENDVDQDLIDTALELAKEDHVNNNVKEDPEIDGMWENNECIIVTFDGWA